MIDVMGLRAKAHEALVGCTVDHHPGAVALLGGPGHLCVSVGDDLSGQRPQTVQLAVKVSSSLETSIDSLTCQACWGRSSTKNEPNFIW